jgi:hypothetical protein
MADPPPSRVTPVPIQVVHHAINQAYAHGHVKSLAVIQMIAIAFFFFMHPVEQKEPTGGNTPFTIPIPFLASVTFVTYCFTRTQKNSALGKVVGLGRSGHHCCCLIEAAANCLRHLWLHNAPGDTPLCTYISVIIYKVSMLLPQT